MSANRNGVSMKRQERHDWIVLLREQGKTLKQCAELMGVAVSTVTSAYYDPTGEKERARKEQYGGACRDCGGRTAYTKGGTAERCQQCSDVNTRTIESRRAAAKSRGGHVTWTDEQILDAIRSIAVNGQATTTAYDEATQNGRRGKIPIRGTIIWRFGSWRNAVHAAGLVTSRDNTPEVYANRMSNEGLLLALEDCAGELGRWPSSRDYDRWAAGGRGPMLNIIRQRFGSWMDAFEQVVERNGGEVPS